MASTKKKANTSIMSEWDTLLRRGSHLAREASGEVYRVQPVDLETFVNSPEYLNQGMWGMSDEQRDFIEKGSDLENGITFFVMFVGKGGGKNWATGILFLYVIYKLMCMYDPHKYLNHNRSKAITLINVAINAKQAQKNFFDPMSNILKEAGPSAFKQFGFDPDTDILTTQIVFPGNIEIMSANSRAGGIEGYDILLAMADEVDDSEFHGVEKIINTLRTSSESRFTGKEKVIVISYRRYEGSSGKILDYYNKFKSMTHIYARRYASWEFHPIRTYEDFVNYYKENPEKAACMYGSVDTGSYIDSWIKDPKRIKASMNLERTWIFDWPLPYQTSIPGTKDWWSADNHDEWKQSPMSEHSYVDANGVTHMLDPYDIPIKEHGNPRYKYVLCGDPALGSEANGGDGYGVTLAHREIIKGEDGKKYIRPIIDFAFRFTGRMFDEGQVQMNAIEKLIRKLKEQYGYDIRIFSFDGWNSISLTQWISKQYKNSIVYDRNIVETADYTTLRDSIFGEAPPSNGKGSKETNGGIDWPWHPIIYEEARNLKEDRTKNPPKVDHPDNGTKDIMDTIAKATRIIIHQWPFMDVYAAGTNVKERDVERRVDLGVASQEETKDYYENMYSSSVGLGSWKEKTSQGRQITYDELFNE